MKNKRGNGNGLTFDRGEGMDDGDCCGKPFLCLTCGDTLPSDACVANDCRNEFSAGGVSEDCLAAC